MDGHQYPIAIATSEGSALSRSMVDVEALTEQLIPIRDALLKLFEGLPAKSRGELQGVELGVHMTAGGNVALVSGNMVPSLKLILGSRQRSPSTRSTMPRSSPAKKPDVVEIG